MVGMSPIRLASEAAMSADPAERIAATEKMLPNELGLRLNLVWKK